MKKKIKKNVEREKNELAEVPLSSIQPCKVSAETWREIGPPRNIMQLEKVSHES